MLSFITRAINAWRNRNQPTEYSPPVLRGRGQVMVIDEVGSIPPETLDRLPPIRDNAKVTVFDPPAPTHWERDRDDPEGGYIFDNGDDGWGLEMTGLFAVVHSIDTRQYPHLKSQFLHAFHCATEAEFRQAIARIVNKEPDAPWAIRLKGAMDATGGVAHPTAGLLGVPQDLAVPERPISATATVTNRAIDRG